MHEIIRMDSLYLQKSNKPILNGISLQISAGEIVGLLGRNGSGKTTLLRSIFGIQKPNHIHIRYNEKPVTALYQYPRLAAFLPQYSTHPKSVKVHSLFKLYDINAQDLYKRFPLLNQLNLSSRLSDFSAGEKRLIEIILVAASNTKFSLLDEPFTYLMPAHIAAIKDFIVQSKRSKGFILCDHQFRNVMDIADRLFLIKNGILFPVTEKEDLVRLGYLNG